MSDITELKALLKKLAYIDKVVETASSVKSLDSNTIYEIVYSHTILLEALQEGIKDSVVLAEVTALEFKIANLIDLMPEEMLAETCKTKGQKLNSLASVNRVKYNMSDWNGEVWVENKDTLIEITDFLKKKMVFLAVLAGFLILATGSTASEVISFVVDKIMLGLNPDTVRAEAILAFEGAMSGPRIQYFPSYNRVM